MSDGAFEIDRVAATLSDDEFHERYYLPQRPVVIEGMAAEWLALERWSAPYLEKTLANAPQVVWWYQPPPGTLASDYSLPPFLARHATILQQSPPRIWLSGSGMVTPWHYDGHAPQILNVQIRGRKRFCLISSDTPLPYVPFWFESVLGALAPEDPRLRRYRRTTFELGPGDAVFIPMHWSHHVTSLEAENISFNWCWTDLDRFRASHTALAEREREVLVLGYHFERMFRFVRARTSVGREYYAGPYTALARYVRQFGFAPRPYEIAEELLPQVSTFRLLLRCAREVVHAAAAIPMYRRRDESERAELGAPRTADSYYRVAGG